MACKASTSRMCRVHSVAFLLAPFTGGVHSIREDSTDLGTIIIGPHFSMGAIIQHDVIWRAGIVCVARRRCHNVLVVRRIVRHDQHGYALHNMGVQLSHRWRSGTGWFCQYSCPTRGVDNYTQLF